MPEIDNVKKWFIENKRSFPWRENSSPYAVWISEVMLQQTRASVVVAYFLRWMERFPTIASLANAPMEEVLKVWEGLGYYKRVRNLHEAAKNLFGEVIPSSLEKLLEIKGIGSYTAGAILSFAFHQKAAAVDGNVARVISRYLGLEEDLTKAKGKAFLEKTVLALLPEEEPWVVMEAFIEIGATLCLSLPKCHQCPLNTKCRAFLGGKTHLIPYKKKRKPITYLDKQVVLIIYEGEILLEIKEDGVLFGGLAQFPSFPYSIQERLEDQVKLHFNLEVIWQEDLQKTKQSFTRYQEELYPVVCRALVKKECSGFFWYKIESLSLLSFSSGHKRIVEDLFLRSSPSL